MDASKLMPEPSDASDPAAWGEMLKQAVSQGSGVQLKGRKISLGTNGSLVLSTKEIAREVINLTYKEGAKLEHLSSRYYDYQSLDSGLAALKDKADHTVKARIFNFFGKQTNSQKALGQAQDAVHRTLDALENEMKTHFTFEKLLTDATATLDKFKASEEEHPENLKKFVFHRCLDRVTDNPVIDASAKELNAADFGWVLDSMRREIEHISNDPSAGFAHRYNDEERQALREVGNQLEWAAKADTMLNTQMGGVKEFAKLAKQNTEDIDKFKQRSQVMSQSLAELDAALQRQDPSILNRFAEGQKHENSQTAWTNTFICNKFIESTMDSQYAKSLKLQQQITKLLQDENASNDDINALRQEKRDLDAKNKELRAQIQQAFEGSNALTVFEQQGFNKEDALDKLRSLKDTLVEEHARCNRLLDEATQKASYYDENLERSIISLNMVTNWITDRISNQAKLGKSTMFAGGLNDHAMMYNVQPMPDGSFTFSVINTGLGTEYHHAHEDGKIQTHLKWSGLSKEQVTNPNFIRQLLTFRQHEKGEFKSEEEKLPPIYDANPIHKLYQCVADHLGTPDSASLFDEDYHKGQIHGTCTQQVTNTWMHQLLPEALYRKFKVDLTDRSLAQLDELDKVAAPGSKDAKLYEAMRQETEKIRESRARKAEKQG